MHRALDRGRERRRAIEVFRQENPLQQRFDLIAAVSKRAAQFALDRAGDLLADKIPIELRGHELAGHVLSEDDVDDVLAVEGSGSSEKRLFAEVMLVPIELERQSVGGPPAARQRGLGFSSSGRLVVSIRFAHHKPRRWVSIWFAFRL